LQIREASGKGKYCNFERQDAPKKKKLLAFSRPLAIVIVIKIPDDTINKLIVT
jgi:hypothetical protein